MRVVQLLLLALSAWGVNYARFSLGPLQEAMRINLSLSDNQMAWLQGPALAVPMALVAIPMGLLIDRFPRTRLFLLFATLSLVANVLAALASTTALLFAARCLTGLSLAAILVAAYSMVADLYVPGQRGRATMVVAIGEIGGAPAAFALGGVLLTMRGVGAGGWRCSLLWMSVVLLPVALSMLALREPPRTGAAVKNPPLRKVWAELWRFRVVILPLLVARIMVWIADGAVLVWAAPTLSRRFGFPPDRIGAIMGTTLLVSGILGPTLGGPLADLCYRAGGPRRTVTVLGILALLSALAALFAIMPSPTLACILMCSFLTLGYTIGTAAITLATIVIPGEFRGLYLAITITVGALFFIGVAPLIVSGLSSAIGGPAKIGQALAIVCGTASFLAAIILTSGSRYFARAPG
jgi:predicted MFS family arabinose efflux permease